MPLYEKPENSRLNEAVGPYPDLYAGKEAWDKYLAHQKIDLKALDEILAKYQLEEVKPNLSSSSRQGLDGTLSAITQKLEILGLKAELENMGLKQLEELRSKYLNQKFHS